MGLVRWHKASDHRRGFTLVELLVVIGIIALLMGLLLPSLSNARANARTLKCTSQVRQICIALTAYAAEHRQKFPPNFDMPSPGVYWYDAERIGRYLPDQAKLANGIGGGVLVCPEDESSQRSYAMNIWASSAADKFVTGAVPVRGALWSPSAGSSAMMILVAERWSSMGSAAPGYYAPPTIGFWGDKPGQRFGVDGGISPPLAAGRFGMINCELPYIRHRGRVNIGYADGHVEPKSEFDLAELSTGRSTCKSLWSPLDRQIEDEH